MPSESPKTHLVNTTDQQREIDEIISFLSLLWSNFDPDNGSYARLLTIAGDPDAATDRHKANWHERIASQSDIERIAHTLYCLGQSTNVYVSNALFDGPTTRGQTPRAGRVLFADDVQLDQAPWSIFVKTGPTGGHGYLLLDAPISPTQRKQAQAAMAMHLHGDMSGHALNKMVRIPHTYNFKTKYGKLYRATLTTGNQTNWGDVLAQFPIDAYYSNVLAANEGKIELYNGNIDQLLNDQGLPKRIKNRIGVAIFKACIERDYTDSSAMRHRAMKSLMMHAYPLGEITALINHFVPAPHKPKGWLANDIARIYAKIMAAHGSKLPAPAATKQFTKHNPPKPLAHKQPQGRIEKVTPDAYLEWLKANATDYNTIDMPHAAIAERFGVSLRTISQIESQLRNEGKIKRVRKVGERGTLLVLIEETSDQVTCTKPDHSSAVACQNQHLTRNKHDQQPNKDAPIVPITEPKNAPCIADDLVLHVYKVDLYRSEDHTPMQAKPLRPQGQIEVKKGDGVEKVVAGQNQPKAQKEMEDEQASPTDELDEQGEQSAPTFRIVFANTQRVLAV